MAQYPDQNFYPHQMQIPPQFRNPFDLVKLFDERTGALNYNYIRPYMPPQLQPASPYSDNGLSETMMSDSLVMRRPRRTRTTFTCSQIAALEEHFKQGKYLNTTRLADVSNSLSLGNAQVKIWFKNRRRRLKIEQTLMRDQQQNDSSSSEAICDITLQPKDIKCLQLNTTSATLTPSPTPSSTSIAAEQYQENPGNYNYYYFNQGFDQKYPPMPQYYPTPPATTHQQQFEFPKVVKAEAVGEYSYNQPPQTQAPPPQQQPPHNPYVRMSNTESMMDYAKLYIKPEPDLQLAGMSPNSEVYEPLTPKTDESPTAAVDDLDKMKKSAPDGVVATAAVVSFDHQAKAHNETPGGFQQQQQLNNNNNSIQTYSNNPNNSNMQYAYCFN